MTSGDAYAPRSLQRIVPGLAWMHPVVQSLRELLPEDLVHNRKLVRTEIQVHRLRQRSSTALHLSRLRLTLALTLIALHLLLSRWGTRMQLRVKRRGVDVWEASDKLWDPERHVWSIRDRLACHHAQIYTAQPVVHVDVLGQSCQALALILILTLAGIAVERVRAEL